MKIAVLADIHANIVALEAVTDHIERWDPDIVVVAGDVVNRGPRPLECLRFVQAKQRGDGWPRPGRGWLVIRGNHEDYVISHKTGPYNGVETEIFQNSRWTFEKLNGDVSALESWPFSISWLTGSNELRAAHASMRGNRDGIYVETDDDTLRQQVGAPPPGVLVVGHTHKPLVRSVDDTLVVNVGAAGLPFDGDPRACYARLYQQNGWWRAGLIRLDYDREAVDRDFIDSGFLDSGGALARLIRVELRLARSQIAEWTTAYEAKVRAGELSIEESVERFLAEEGITETD
jgi:predicted phosphodiesterase